MFEIEYKGGNSVWITTKNSSLVVDPNLASLGLKQPKLPKDAIQIATENRFLVNDKDLLTLEGPGEYEAGPFSIVGIAAQRHIDTEHEPMIATVYRIEVLDTRIAVIGNIAGSLSDDQLEGIGVVDILILPVGGGGFTLDAMQAVKITRNIEPKVVIPVHYADNKVSYEVPQESLEVFTKELGAPVEEMPKLKIKSAASIPQVLTVLALEQN